MSFDNEESLIRSDEMDYEEFRISPSGNYLASEVNAFQGEEDQIILFEIEIGSIRPLTQGFQHFDPAWSPDESRIVSGGIKEGKQGLYVSNVDGSGSEEVLWEAPAQSGNVHQLDWSPKNDYLVFKLTGEAEFDIWLYSLADSSVSPLIEDPRNQRFPRFSRNGQYIAYQSDELGTDDIFVKSVDGRSKWPVTTSGGSEPVWSVSGDEIYYRIGGIVYGIAVETEPVFRVAGQPREIFDAGSPIRFDVHPNGEGFVISRSGTQSAGHFEIIYNFSEYLKQVAPPTE